MQDTFAARANSAYAAARSSTHATTSCMQDNFYRALGKARDDRVSCIQYDKVSFIQDFVLS